MKDLLPWDGLNEVESTEPLDDYYSIMPFSIEERTVIYPIMRVIEPEDRADEGTPEYVIEDHWELVGYGVHPETGEKYGKFKHTKELDRFSEYLPMDYQNCLLFWWNDQKRKQNERQEKGAPASHIGVAATRALEQKPPDETVLQMFIDTAREINRAVIARVRLEVVRSRLMEGLSDEDKKAIQAYADGGTVSFGTPLLQDLAETYREATEAINTNQFASYHRKGNH